MENTSAFEEFETNGKLNRRRNLLPLWIKIFLWFFLIAGALCVSFLIFGVFSSKIDLSLYGIDAQHPYTVPGLIISSLFIYKGIVAFGLWFEETWAPKAAIIDAIIGIAVCIVMMILPFVLPDNLSFTLRLELIPLYFYLVKMREIKQIWEKI
ncbi:hypothetical protein [uncultured Chryseobacterium sp.]|uniref:hypothetical protein n=1 Tax=uncultured Chryseobacterium sp. TaxID=259322 RepID=UPI002584EFEF|nr:hypothetical protein [uncultured Chryseobacterium sp.]